MAPATRTSLPAFALCLLFCAVAHGAVIYDFSGTVNMIGATQVFRYTAPTFITSDTFVPASAMDMCSSGFSLPCYGVNFLPSGPDTPEHYPELTFQTLNPDSSVGTIFYYFPLASSFATPGTLKNVPTLGNNGTLVISESPTSVVPEPRTGAMVVLAGLAALLFRPRRLTRMR